MVPLNATPLTAVRLELIGGGDGLQSTEPAIERLEQEEADQEVHGRGSSPRVPKGISAIFKPQRSACPVPGAAAGMQVLPEVAIFVISQDLATPHPTADAGGDSGVHRCLHQLLETC